MENLTTTLISQILATTFIYSDSVRRLSILKSLLIGKVFASAAPVQKDNYYQDADWLKNLPPDFLAQFNGSNLYQVFEAAEDILKKTNYLILYLPIELPPAEAENLGSYLRNNFGREFLFEVKYDPALIGGCGLVWKGVYRDYSLKQKISDNHYSILKLLKEYV